MKCISAVRFDRKFGATPNGMSIFFYQFKNIPRSSKLKKRDWGRACASLLGTPPLELFSENLSGNDSTSKNCCLRPKTDQIAVFFSKKCMPCVPCKGSCAHLKHCDKRKGNIVVRFPTSLNEQNQEIYSTWPKMYSM